MKILVDTSVWSLALRRKQTSDDDTSIIKELQELIRELRVVMIGPTRQELLTGITDRIKYEQLRDRLSAFDDAELDSGIYEMAAEISNTCRKNGIQGSHTDFLISAFSIHNRCPVFTLDKDFNLYKKYINLMLHAVREEFQ